MNMTLIAFFTYFFKNIFCNADCKKIISTSVVAIFNNFILIINNCKLWFVIFFNKEINECKDHIEKNEQNQLLHENRDYIL